MTDRPREVVDWLDRLAPEQREQAHVLASLAHAAGPTDSPDRAPPVLAWGCEAVAAASRSAE